MLGHPPVVLFLEVAHGDHAGAGADSEFRFVGRPADVCGRAVDAEEDEGGFPPGLGGLPNERIAVCSVEVNFMSYAGVLRWMHTLGTGNNPSALRSNVYTCHGLVMSDELLLELEAVVPVRVQLDLGIAGHREEGPVCAEGVVRDGLVEEEVHFGGYHDDEYIFFPF